MKLLFKVQAMLQAIRLWFLDKEFWIISFAVFWGLISFAGIPSLNRAMRLRDSGRTNAVVIANGFSETVGGGNQGASTTTKAQVSGNSRWFWADRLYHKGDHAFLTFSDRLDYGVVTAVPPKSLFDTLIVDNDSFSFAFSIIAVMGALIISNLGLILLAVFEHTIGMDMIRRMKEAHDGLQRTLVIGSIALEAMLAAALSFVPIAATMAAFSVSLKIGDESPRRMYLIYASTLLFSGSHISAGAAILLLKFFRTKLGHGLKEIGASFASLVAAVRVLVEIVHLTCSKNVVNMSSWWEVAKEFAHSLIK